MKVSIATALSVAGVLAAGAAAYAVNVSVLDAPSSSDTSLVSTTLPAEAASANTATNGAVSADGVRVNDTTTSYQVGTAGTVVVDTSSGAVVVTSVIPNAGYTAEPARSEANGLVKVHFLSSGSRIEFTAQLVNGEVVVKTTNEAMNPVAGTPSKPSFPGGGRDDDDDREGHEDREHHDFEGDDD